MIQSEQLHILLDDGVLGVTKNTDKRVAIQIGQRDDNGQTANKLGNQAELNDIVGNDILKNALFGTLSLLADITAEANSGKNRQKYTTEILRLS